jgi:hypothetical protein
VIPASATVTIDARMVKGMDGRKTGQQMVDHVRKQGFFGVDREPTADERRTHPKVARVVIAPGVGFGYGPAATRRCTSSKKFSRNVSCTVPPCSGVSASTTANRLPSGATS